MGDATGSVGLDTLTGALAVETIPSSLAELNVAQILILLLMEMRVQSQLLQIGLNVTDDLDVLRNDVRSDLAILGFPLTDSLI